MKELTIEQKARAYDEALEKAKTLYENANGMILKKWVEQVFPELAESEDEKMMKEIIELVMQPIWKTEKEFYRRNELCAWLKKQVEHANFLSKIQVDDKVTRNEAGVLVNLSQLNRVAKNEGKQGGQKFEMKSAAESLGVDSDTYNKIVDECIFGEQKAEENKRNIGGISPNWSEKDEAVLDALIRRLEGEDIHVSPHLAVECLESLKGRVGCEANCTTTKEWSEDDKRKIDRIYSILRQAADTHAFSTSCRLIGDKECMELQDFLKSLRPQKRWKPSDEQMGCLSDAIEHYNSLVYPAPKLKELYEQLKKL